LILTLGINNLSATTIDFEGFEHGRIINNQYAGIGVTISADNFTGPDLAIIFDSTIPNDQTSDDDLTGPPWPLGNLPNDTVLGNLLIIAENAKDVDPPIGVIDDPDDEASRPAGAITFEFGFGISEFGFDLVDVEGTAEFDGGYFAAFFNDGVELGKILFPEFTQDIYGNAEFGNNSANRISPISFNGDVFDEVIIGLGGSAGVDNIYFKPVPEPATLLLMGTGLAGLLGAGRKKFIKKNK